MFNCSVINSMKIINLFLPGFPHLLNEDNTWCNWQGGCVNCLKFTVSYLENGANNASNSPLYNYHCVFYFLLTPLYWGMTDIQKAGHIYCIQLDMFGAKYTPVTPSPQSIHKHIHKHVHHLQTPRPAHFIIFLWWGHLRSTLLAECKYTIQHC